VTGDEIGLGFYTDDESQGRPGKPSVFGVPDQTATIARIDAVSDDDMDSSFFADSIQDVEDAATRVFDIGVRTIAHDGTTVEPVMSFGAPRPQPAATLLVPAPLIAPVRVTVPMGADEAGRRAFILGGPAAIRRS
jgi:hypothetical protein